MPELSIRRAAVSDAPLVVALLRELAVYEKLLDTFRLDEALAARDMLGAGAVARCEIAFVKGEAAGLAVWFWTYKSFRARRGLFVEDLYVRPQWRGQGVGKALFGRLAREAAAADAGYMEWVVLDWNRSAIDFYRRIGAQLAEDWITCRLDGAAMTELGA